MKNNKRSAVRLAERSEQPICCHPGLADVLMLLYIFLQNPFWFSAMIPSAEVAQPDSSFPGALSKGTAAHRKDSVRSERSAGSAGRWEMSFVMGFPGSLRAVPRAGLCH